MDVSLPVTRWGRLIDKVRHQGHMVRLSLWFKLNRIPQQPAQPDNWDPSWMEVLVSILGRD